MNKNVKMPDGSIALMNSSNCEPLLKNIDRGLRMETYITLGEKLDSYPLSGEEPYERAKMLFEKYREDSPTLCQVYVYLCNYNEKPLDDLAFSQMKRFFELFRDNGIRMLLRFAYGTEAVEDAAYKIVRGHLAQLDKWFKENSALISDTLYCMQTGIIGWWGEGHSNIKLKSKYIPNVIADVCRLAPEGIYSQVRTYGLLKKVKKSDIKRVGIHDDYIIGEMDHKWAFIPNDGKFLNTIRFNKSMERAKYTVNDGEMPWGNARYNDDPNGRPLDSLDGMLIAKQLNTYCLTSFSLEHNYHGGKELHMGSMHCWKSQLASFEELKKLGISANPALFRDENGKDIKMSMYDVIRYHLGYHLVLSNYSEKDGRAGFRIYNFGFAAPHNFNYLALVFRDKTTGKLSEAEIKSYDKTKLLSGEYCDYSAEILNNSEPVGVKLSMFKGRKQCARFANSTKFENGVQYFK